jgi:ectoine hydroxylase-related dioxygenase (phytanoyl-CoA dioxygenase family)
MLPHRGSSTHLAAVLRWAEISLEGREVSMRLSEDQVQQYLDDGFLVVEDVFTTAELQPVIDHFEVIVDDWVGKLYAAGKLKNKYQGEDVYTRLASVEKEWPGAAALVTQRNSMFPALAHLWNSDQLLDMVEQFIGPDIAGHPVSIFRSKTPDTALMTVPWHQDSAYFVEGGEGTLQPTAWIPFIDTTVENGTLQLIRGSHRSGKVFPHRLEKDIGHRESWYLYIADEDQPPGDRVICDIKMGSVLWLQNMIVHRSTENLSDKVRWTCDLRYQRPGEPTGFPASTELPPMRRADDPEYRLDVEAFIAHEAEGNQSYRRLTGDDFEYSAPDSPWLVRWQKYGEEAA